jgi:NO-binding membrane sensor protein with MHYT domain
MKTLTMVLGATLIVMFGIRGMYHTAFPAIVLDPGSSILLERIAPDQSAQEFPFVNAVMTIDLARYAAAAKEPLRCVTPVSLEKVAR